MAQIHGWGGSGRVHPQVCAPSRGFHLVVKIGWVLEVMLDEIDETSLSAHALGHDGIEP